MAQTPGQFLFAHPLTRARPPATLAPLMTDVPYDILIRGGTIIDGTGAPGYRGDRRHPWRPHRGHRGPREGFDGSARRVVDASGRAVAPGFIDVHAHDDAAVLSTPMDFKLMQGVTTDIVGNCGAGIAPALTGGAARPSGRRDRARPAARRHLGQRSASTWTPSTAAHPAVNVACLVPHGVVRARAVGMDSRAPDDASSARCGGRRRGHGGGGRRPLRQASSTCRAPSRRRRRSSPPPGLPRRPAASTSATSGTRATRLLEAVGEAITIGREAGLPVQVSHHKSSDKPNWGGTKASIALIEKERAAGMDVTFDVYPYTAGSTILAAARGVQAEIDPEMIMVASVREKREYEGKNLAQIAELLGMDPTDGRAVVSRVLSDEPAAVAVFFSMDEADVRRVMAHPLCMIGSDGIPSPTGKPHPRLYGTFARVIAKYVREAKLFSLEEAIRKMSGAAGAPLQAGRARRAA